MRKRGGGLDGCEGIVTHLPIPELIALIDKQSAKIDEYEELLAGVDVMSMTNGSSIRRLFSSSAFYWTIKVNRDGMPIECIAEKEFKGIIRAYRDLKKNMI
jgi:hypothetical protein